MDYRQSQDPVSKCPTIRGTFYNLQVSHPWEDHDPSLPVTRMHWHIPSSEIQVASDQLSIQPAIPGKPHYLLLPAKFHSTLD